MEKIPEIIHPSWHSHLQPLFNDQKMLMIKNDTLTKIKFYPEPDKIFRVFQMPLDQIKVVILGQDPYPNGEAIGLSFAVKSSTPLPGSLKVIKNEIINSKVERDTYINIEGERWRALHHWTQQKVFLLNMALTVEAKHSGSHMGIWNWFAREVVKVISTYQHPIWLLWGAKAKGAKYYMPNNHLFKPETGLIRSPNVNYILEADHPAAELYPGSKYKFSGCNHFNLCNQILKLKKQTIINW